MIDPVSVGLGFIPTAYKLLERLYDPKLKEKERKKMAYNLIETSLKSFIFRWKDFSVWTPKTHIFSKGIDIAQLHKELFLEVATKTDSLIDEKMTNWLMSISGNLNEVIDFVGGLGQQPVKEFIQKGNRVQGYCEKALTYLKGINS